jgi:hypothetical protein
MIRNTQLDASAPGADVMGVAEIVLRATACPGSGAAANS